MAEQMGKFILNWRPEQIYVRMERVQADGLNDTLDAIAAEAQRRVRYKTGNLRSKIKVIKRASKAGNRIQGRVGVENVDYALDQERGPQPGSGRRFGFTPYLRPAYQLESRRLAARIRERFKNG